MRNIHKHIKLLVILALAAVGIVSCSDETQSVGDIKVTFITHLPQESRAFGDAAQANTLWVAAYAKKGDTYVEIERKSTEMTNAASAVQFTLVKEQPYTFIFWAQNSECTVYDTEDLTAIVMGSHSNPITFEESEKCDAFYATYEITTSSNAMEEIVLTRPLAQINVGTTGESFPVSLTVESAPTTFHPLTKSVSGSADYTWELDDTTTEKLSVNGTEYNYLAMGYLFASESAISTTAELTITSTGRTIAIDAVTLQSNNRCNILGNIIEN